jgi:cytochrome c
VKHVRAAAIVCGVGLMMSLLLGMAHPFGDAAGAASETPIAENAAVPANVRAVLAAKCADCHSMETRPQIYAHLAPASWLMERDIVKAREAMNLDAWGSYSADQRQIFAAKMVQETRSREMPLVQYRMIHRNTRITDADVRVFAQWAHSLQDVETQPMVMKAAAVRLAPVAMVHVQSPVDAPAAEDAGDAVRGKDVFERRCAGCHAMNEDREGPRLQGVYGRAAGGVAGFGYSAALKQAHIVWNDVTLEQWLADPDTLVPGNDMDFHVAKPQERKDLIRYLQESAN